MFHFLAKPSYIFDCISPLESLAQLLIFLQLLLKGLFGLFTSGMPLRGPHFPCCAVGKRKANNFIVAPEAALVLWKAEGCLQMPSRLCSPGGAFFRYPTRGQNSLPLCDRVDSLSLCSILMPASSFELRPNQFYSILCFCLIMAT